MRWPKQRIFLLEVLSALNLQGALERAGETGDTQSAGGAGPEGKSLIKILNALAANFSTRFLSPPRKWIFFAIMPREKAGAPRNNAIKSVRQTFNHAPRCHPPVLSADKISPRARRLIQNTTRRLLVRRWWSGERQERDWDVSNVVAAAALHRLMKFPFNDCQFKQDSCVCCVSASRGR